MLKYAQNDERKTLSQFPATTPSCSVVKIGCLDDPSLDIFQPQESSGEGQSLQQKERQREKRKGKKNPKVEKPKAVDPFLVNNLKILISAHARAEMS